MLHQYTSTMWNFHLIFQVNKKRSPQERYSSAILSQHHHKTTNHKYTSRHHTIMFTLTILKNQKIPILQWHMMTGWNSLFIFFKHAWTSNMMVNILHFKHPITLVHSFNLVTHISWALQAPDKFVCTLLANLDIHGQVKQKKRKVPLGSFDVECYSIWKVAKVIAFLNSFPEKMLFVEKRYVLVFSLTISLTLSFSFPPPSPSFPPFPLLPPFFLLCWFLLIFK